MKRLALLLLCCCTLLAASAQYYTNQNKVWAFGDHVGLNFTSGTPVPFTSAISVIEGCASVCDQAGNLLFYSDGKTVYNRLGSVMPSGSAIVPFMVISGTQSAVIVPFIGDTNKYYLFSLESASTGLGRLAYSIIDMTLDGGLGDILPGAAGIIFHSNVGEKMMVVPGDLCTAWLMVHRKDTAQFRAFSITPSGLNTTPVKSNVGPASSYFLIGTMKCSHDRQKIACANYGLGFELYDFDPATGIVSNCRVLDTLTGVCYGVEFSPDNSKLYATQNDVYQWDISLPTTAAIIASKTTVGTIGTTYGKDLRLGPDAKIYVCRPVDYYLDCISNPNALGSGCGYVSSAVYTFPNLVQSGFPNVVRSVVQPTISGVPSVCLGATTTMSCTVPGGVWTSGNPAVATVGGGIVSGVAPGTAIISYSMMSGCEGTVIVTVVATPALTSASVCLGSSTVLTASTGGGTWTSGSTATATVGASSGMVTGLAAGTATITYTAGGCSGTTTVTVTAISISGSGSAVCPGATVTLSSATPGGIWSSGSTSTATIGPSSGVVAGVAAGTAAITYTAGGCSSTTIVTVTAISISGSGSAVCPGATVTLSSSMPGGIWSSGSTSTATIGPSSGVVTGIAAGTVEMTYTASGCSSTIIVTVNPNIPPGNITLCAGMQDTLTGSIPGGTWSSSNTAAATVGSSSGIVIAVAAGTAVISYINAGQCPETFNVTVNPLPASTAGPTTVAIGSSITLTNATTGGTWSSSDVTKGTVNSTTGKVTGVALGATTIYYTLPTGCKVSVIINVVKKTSVAGIPDIAKPSLYPNPATNEITITADPTIFTSVIVYNAVGQEIIRKEITDPEMKIDLSAFPPGAYQVVFKGAYAKEMIRFMKR